MIVRRGHPLTGSGPASVKDLAGDEWVVQPRGAPLRRTIETMFLAEHAPTPEGLSNMTSLLLTMILVAKSDAIAPISLAAAKYTAQSPGGGPGDPADATADRRAAR